MSRTYLSALPSKEVDIVSVVESVDGPIAAREPSIRRVVAVGEGLVQGLCDVRLGPVHARLEVDITL